MWSSRPLKSTSRAQKDTPQQTSLEQKQPEPVTLYFTPDSDDVPTPKGNAYVSLKSPEFGESVTTPSIYMTQVPNRRRSTNSADTEFEEESDVSSDDDSEMVPIRVSNSIKRYINRLSIKGGRPPSLVIPSPGEWPSVHKPTKSGELTMHPSGPVKTPLSPAALAALANNCLQVPPTRSNPPSLDGSHTTDEALSASCPSTPDMRQQQTANVEWDMPVQLNQAALDTLVMLSLEVFEPEPETEVPQMQERGLALNLVIPAAQSGGDEELVSAISIPSPGGFFSSLAVNAQQMWTNSSVLEAPATATAAQFYGVSWRGQHQQVLEDLPEVKEEEEIFRSISRQETATTCDVEIDEILLEGREYEYDEDYEQKLHETANSNMSRTSMWISAQNTYLSALQDTNPLNAKGTLKPLPKTPDSSAMSDSNSHFTFTSPSKKSVRFVETPTTAVRVEHPARSDSLFYQAFQHLNNATRRTDSVVHSSARDDALQNQRLYLPERHCAYLLRRFEIADPVKPTQDLHSQVQEDDVEARKRKEQLILADKQRQALKQIATSFWNVEAHRILNSGDLLPELATEHIVALERVGATPRILDLDGQPLADFGWAMALTYRNAKVYTAIPTSSLANKTDWTVHRGPSNHRTTSVPNTWTLPFPSESFDVISARSLHTLLRTTTSPTRSGQDEYDATLTELNRVLAPGGVIHFSLLEGEITAPCPGKLSGLSIEFAVALRTRGYDPWAARHFIGRLDKSGFEDVQRAWVSLPLGKRDAEGAEATTSLLGAAEWEKWMLKLQVEMGRPEDRLLANVAAALEETRRQVGDGVGTAGWKMLTGCARKAYGEI